MNNQNNKKNQPNRDPRQDSNEQVLEIRRVSQKTKGGNNISFSVLVVTGDRKGSVGIGQGKAPSVADAIKKASRLANRDLVKLPIKNGTIPFETKAKFKSANVLLKPAPKGTGIIAGGAIRSIVEVSGVTDIVAKMLGSNNKSTNAKATLKALKEIELLDKKHQELKRQKNNKK